MVYIIIHNMHSTSFDLHELPKRYDQIYSYFFRRLNDKSDVEKLTIKVLIILAQKQEKIFDPNTYLHQLKEIVNLCISQDFKSSKVAQKLNISAVNTRQRLSRDLKKLRDKCLEVWMGG